MMLAKDLLSLESPTRGKFILLSSLSQHLPANKFLQASPQLPIELLSVMGHQALACHVRKYDIHCNKNLSGGRYYICRLVIYGRV